MARERALTLRIASDSKAARRDMAGLSKDVDKTGRSIGKSSMGIRDSLLGIGVAAGAAFAFSEWNDAQKVGAQTEAMLKSTGGAANTTADEIGDLSEALSEKAGVDDELIQSGANLLGTFTKVRNEVGEGNDIFDQATTTALDLSVALGTDMTSASMMLGKALNDPIKGITSLTRAGVQFTADQKEQIKTLVETGDVLGAQKIILAELETQVGGSAEAQATAYDKAKVSAGNLAETVGGTLAPAIEGVAGLAATGADAFSGLDSKTQTVTAVVGLGGLAWLKYRDDVMGAMSKAREIPGALSGGLNSIGKMDTALLGMAAGATAFTLTTEVLERLSETGTDLVDLAADLEQLGEGSATVNDVFATMGTDLDGLSSAFIRAGDAPKDYGDAVQYFFTRVTSDPGLTGLREAQNRVGEFDETLAGMVRAGNADEAAVAFDKITEALIDQGFTYDEITPLMPEYYEEVERVGREGSNAATAILGTVDAVEAQGGASEEATVQTKNHADAMSHFTQEAGDAEDALRGYYDELFGRLTGTVDVERALDDYANGLFANSTILDPDDERGRQNLENMEAVGRAALEMAAQMNATGDVEGARNLMEQYRLKLIDTWTQAGYTEDEILVMQTTMGLTPTQLDTKFNTNAPEAQAKVKNLGDVMGVVAGTHVVVDIDDGPVEEAITSLNDLYTLLSAIPSGDGSSERAETRGRRRDNAAGGITRPGDWGWVGEEGPELVNWNTTSRVYPHDESMAMAGGGRVSPLTEMRSGGGSMGGGPLVVQVMLDRKVLAEAVIDEHNARVRRDGRSPTRATQSNFGR